MLRALSLFYRQAGMAYKAGIPLADGLRLAATGCENERLKKAAAEVERRVRGGNPLGPAMAAHPAVFPELHTALVTVGEENGQLDRNLLRLADRSEKEHGERRRFLLALAYPAGLFVAALLLPKLFVWVTVSFSAYLKSVFATALPFLACLGLAVLGSALVRRFSPRPFDRFQLGLPVLGPSLEKLALARFSDSLATLYGAGVELRRSVRLAVRALGNQHLESRCAPLADVLRRGGTMSEGLRACGVFPRDLVNAVDVGERTGELDGALERMARLYEEEADRAIKAILVLVPFAIYLLVALYIAYVVISAYGAIFRSIGSV
ncbi:MAG: type II secretion system F family protein [Thermoanaerobaculia bacterium]